MNNLGKIISRANRNLITKKDIDIIINAGEPYVTFYFENSDTGLKVEFCTDFEPMLDNNCGGDDFAITVSDFERELENFGVIFQIGNKYEFIWEVK